jgi:hypothetical protein
MSVQNILYNVEIAPPPIVWERVATALDNGFTNVKEQLFYNTTEAPAMAWERIATRLDNGGTDIAAILNNFSVDAPASTWGNIDTILNKPESTLKVAYKKPKFLNNVLKAAAGLFLVIGISVGVYKLNNKPVEQTAQIKLPEAAEKQDDKQIIEPPIAKIDVVENNSNKTTSTEKKQIIAGKKVGDATVAKNIPLSRQSHNLIIDVPNEAKLVVKKGMPITPDLTFLDAVDGQVTVAGPNGTNFNISSSLASKLYMSFNAGTRTDKELLDTRIEEAAIWRAKYNAWKLAFENKLMKSTSMFDFIEELAGLKNP